VSAADRLDPNPVVRCSPPAPLTVPIQPVGTATTVVCSATDQAGNAVSRSFRIHVAGAAEQLSALQARVAHVAPSRQVERRLGRDLRRAAHALDHAKPRRACHSLDTFARHVERYRYKGALTGRADRLIADSVRITIVLDCR
jgi:hypothetical protein